MRLLPSLSPEGTMPTKMQRARIESRWYRVSAIGWLALTAGCGSSTADPGGGNNDVATMTMAAPSGDAQQANPSTALASPFRIVITKGGAAVSGTAVSWTVTAGDGSVAPTSSTTGADGTASTQGTIGTNDLTVTASADGVNGSPVTFHAGVIGLSAQVKVQNNSFTPQTVFVKVGGTVTFTWQNGAAGHNVTPDDGKAVPASPGLPALNDAPFTFNAQFNATGDYYYHCANHGATRSGMFGKITVVP
jgi:plastocyanin